MSEEANSVSFVPVIVGGNRGAYSLARAFYEAYQVKTNLISPMIIGPIGNSRIIKHYIQPGIDDLDLFFETIHQIGRDYPNMKKIIFGADDRYAELLIRTKDRFGDDWIIPYVDEPVFLRATNKESFYAICEKAGVPYPKTVVMDEFSLDLPFEFPIIIKPSNAIIYQGLHFEGKEKVFIGRDEKDLERIYHLVRDNGYTDNLILQEYVPGDDTYLGVVTVYTSPRDKEIKLIAFGHILLEDHTPSAIGNHLTIWAREERKIVASVRKLIAETEFYGFSNFDVKYDKRKDDYVFFELNGRLGVSNYYVTASGNNVAKYYVEDFIAKKKLGLTINTNEALFTMTPKKLLLKYIESDVLRKKVKELYKDGKDVHPLDAPFEVSPKRKFYVLASKFNYYKKFKEYPPEE
ncbi:D-aspartate ligase [Trichococcus flocculiformis]|uniref:carboxylate--amine ligase n=1 Tax=Trichococcus TaxID=82802 RepID=UPI0007A8512E|nr:MULTISPECIES: carbamoyl phosphate synthase-like protein [Trichococcus]CZQ89730.1 Hypothetical protein TES5_804 [Trichococcus sp. ES5]SHF48804.1 D-aspartate ligase [Trichococcus flocculiformis]